MSYTKKTWQSGDVIQAANLNNLEDGVDGHDYLTQYLKTDSGGAYLYDPTDGGTKLYLTDLMAAIITCFRGDTTYVTMANGSKKLIQDVKIGDEVLGYDVNRKEYCTTYVIKNVRTGREFGFWTYVMDDGTTVDIWNGDSFITCHKSERFGDTDGDYIAIHPIEQLLNFHNNNEGFRKIIKDTGNLANATGVIYKRYIPCAELTPRYALYTANGTMFVNGLLHAQSPRDTIKYFKLARVAVPETIAQLWNNISASNTVADEGLPNDHIQHPEKIGDLEILAQAKVLIQTNKNYLNSTDYKAMKYAEGAITEEEWLPVKAQRAAAREAINAQEAVVAEYEAKVAVSNPEFIDVDPHSWAVENAKWKADQNVLDSHKEDFRVWVQSIANT